MKGRIRTTSRWLAVLWLALAPVAPAQSPAAQPWISRTSGILYKVTIGDHRVEAEKVFPLKFQEQVELGAFVRCEYSQKGDAWVGACNSRLPFAGSRNHVKWCSFKFSSKITFLTPDKIEGESEVWASEDIDAGKCEIKKSHMQHFVWIPKG